MTVFPVSLRRGALATVLSLVAVAGCTQAGKGQKCPETPPPPMAVAPPTPPSNPPDQPPTVDEARAFFATVDADLRRLFVARDTMDFVNLTYITDDTQKLASLGEEAAMEYLSRAIPYARRYDQLDLPPDLARMRYLLRLAGSVPAPSDAAKRTELAEILTSMQATYGKGKYCPPKLKGKCLDLGDLGKIMAESRDYEELKDAWVGWHAISPPIRDKFARYAELGNEGAREIGFKDLGDLWRSSYDMPPEAFEADVERLWSQVKPLYDELHCYVRAKLQKKYGVDRVPNHGPIPAHLLGNMWAQEWNNIYPLVEPYPGQVSLDVTKGLKRQHYDEQKLVKLGEKFFTSLGMDELPKSFWERSMFRKPRDREVVCHASAWDPSYADDLRIKMCIKVDEEDLITIHHELGHDYYFHYYHTLPMLFQNGANDGFHEGIGDTLALSVTPQYLKSIGLLDQVPSNDKANVDQQMKMALEKVAFLPFGLLIDKWRWDVFSGKTPKDKYNAHWWELRRKYQGVDAPVPRSEADFDPGAKYHVPGNTPYVRYFLARIYQFQFHRALCRAAGHTGPLSTCSIYGNKAAGEKLMAMLKLGASKPWPEALAALSGETQADAGALLEYFAPLQAWLKEQNKGQTCGWEGGDNAPVSSTAAPPPPSTAAAPTPPATSAPNASAPNASAPNATTPAPAAGPAPSGPIASCPPGAELRGDPPPKGREQFCAKKDASGAWVKEGRYVVWGAGNRPEIEGEYANGHESGHWVLYDGNGNKESEGDFKDGKREGVWISYRAGKKTGETTYVNGEPKK